MLYIRGISILIDFILLFLRHLTFTLLLFFGIDSDNTYHFNGFISRFYYPFIILLPFIHKCKILFIRLLRAVYNIKPVLMDSLSFSSILSRGISYHLTREYYPITSILYP